MASQPPVDPTVLWTENGISEAAPDSVVPINHPESYNHLQESLVKISPGCSSGSSSSPPSSMSRYSVLRDADSTVIEYNNSHQYNKLGATEVAPEYRAVTRDDDRKAPQVRTLRPHSTPATLLWLEENYEIAEGVCIPRSALYMHYVDFCARNSIQPVNAASFGKIIRQQFPQLTTRRLGTRGQSRYHYYGIAVRESSPYYQLAYSKKASNSGEAGKREANGSGKHQPTSSASSIYSPRTRMGTVLPDFPNLKEIRLPSGLDPVKTTTFLMMYRTHCQRILDTVIRANFEEVQTFLLHFWNGVPPHLSSLLASNAFVSLIGACDCILYKSIASVLLPSVLQTLPDSLTKIIRKFGSELDYWLKMALYNLPENLRAVKLELARRLALMLRRQISLSHLSQASRMVVHNSDLIAQMVHDWRQIELENICRETLCLYSSDESSVNDVNLLLMRNACRDFEKLLEEEVPIEGYLEWLDSLVQQCVVFPSVRKRVSMRRMARQFLLMWSAFGSRVIRDMTLHSAPSFGSFHLLRLMFDDYILYLVEYVHVEEQINEFLVNVPSDEAPHFMDSYFPEAEMSDPDSALTVETDPNQALIAHQNNYGCDCNLPAAPHTGDAVHPSLAEAPPNVVQDQEEYVYPAPYSQPPNVQQNNVEPHDVRRHPWSYSVTATYGYQASVDHQHQYVVVNGSFSTNAGSHPVRGVSPPISGQETNGVIKGQETGGGGHGMMTGYNNGTDLGSNYQSNEAPKSENTFCTPAYNYM